MSTPIRIGYVPEHYLLPLHLAHRASLFPFPITLIPCPSGTGQMTSLLRSHDLDIAIGLTEGWIAGLLTPQGRRERGYEIVGSWVENPLRWAVVTGAGRKGLEGVRDLGKSAEGGADGDIKVGVSRLGSGSHVMAFVLAQREGWDMSKVGFEVLGPFKDLRDGVQEGGKADFFMWEHFTTKGYWQEGEGRELKWLGEIYTPWPSWCVAAREGLGGDEGREGILNGFFEAVDRGKKMFLERQDECVKLLGSRELGCYYGEEDARQWLTAVKFFEKTRGVDGGMVDKVVEVLKGAGVLGEDVRRVEGDGTVGLRRA
jgi:hypothetical protein